MMRVLQDKVTAALAALCLVAGVMVCLVGVPVAAHAQDAGTAHENLDVNAVGSISVTLETTDGDAVKGGSLSLYKVAEVTADDTGWHFQWLPAYSSADAGLYDATGKLSEAYSKQLASELDGLVGDQAATATATVGEDGTARFSDIGVGLYLVKQAATADGYDAVGSFVVSVPVADEETGALLYDVVASPKAEPVSRSVEPVTPTPSPGTTPAKPSATLPQTGQLWWPVAVLGAAGVVLLCVGVVRSRRAGNVKRAGARG